MPSSSRFTKGPGRFGSIGYGRGETKSATVNLSSTNLLNMNATPVAILAAPGAGKSIIVENIIFKMIRTATAYASGGAVSFVYTGGSVVVHAGSLPATVLTTAGAATTYNELGPAVATNGTAIASNEGVSITNATGAFTTGTGTAVVYIEYRVVNLP